MSLWDTISGYGASLGQDFRGGFGNLSPGYAGMTPEQQKAAADANIANWGGGVLAGGNRGAGNLGTGLRAAQNSALKRNRGEIANAMFKEQQDDAKERRERLERSNAAWSQGGLGAAVAKSIGLSPEQTPSFINMGMTDGLSYAKQFGKDIDKAPTVKKITQSDGSEVTVQWEPTSNSWVPMNAPAGGAAVGSKEKLTESQSKLTLFKSLQTETQPVLLDLETRFNPGNLPDVFAGNVMGGNFYRSQEGQIYDAAATAWAEGALRIATGAAATPEEMIRTKKAYFAQPGDTTETIKFKAQMRTMYDRSIQRALGFKDVEGQLKLPSEFASTMGGGGGAGGEWSIEEIL